MLIKDLLTDESKWCKNEPAKDKNGRSVGSHSPSACRWCLMGAMVRVYGYEPCLNYLKRREIVMAIREIYPETFGASGVSEFNDHFDTTFEMVRKVIEKAGV